MSTQLSDYDFHLPEELIAQRPPDERQQSRMMVVNRAEKTLNIVGFEAFPTFLKAGYLIIRNNTKVIPARLYGSKKDSGGKVEALLCEERKTGLWQAMLKPGRRLRSGIEVTINEADGESFIVEEKLNDGTYLIRFSCDNVLKLLDICGHIPLPHYMNREDDQQDRERYQTVFAKHNGSVAAPTAGLHFTTSLINTLIKKYAYFSVQIHICLTILFLKASGVTSAVTTSVTMAGCVA